MRKGIITFIVVVALAVGGYFLLERAGAPASVGTPAPSAYPAPQSALSPETSNQTAPGAEVPAPSAGEVPASSAPAPQPAPSSANAVVTYTDGGYTPNTLRVKAGATVTFKNMSSQSMWTASAVHPSHSVYSGTPLDEHCPDTRGIAFDACTGTPPGSSWSFTFMKVGTWKYHNHLSAGDTGTIIVE